MENSSDEMYLIGFRPPHPPFLKKAATAASCQKFVENTFNCLVLVRYLVYLSVVHKATMIHNHMWNNSHMLQVKLVSITSSSLLMLTMFFVVPYECVISMTKRFTRAVILIFNTRVSALVVVCSRTAGGFWMRGKTSSRSRGQVELP